MLGPINQVYFTIKPQEGIVATSFKAGDKFYIGGDKLLPLEKYDFLLSFTFVATHDKESLTLFLLKIPSQAKGSARYDLLPVYRPYRPPY